MNQPRGNLPPITFADKTVSAVEADVITTYESISGRTLAAGDPIRLFLESIASLIVNQRNIIDFAGKQNLLSYAQGDYIDHIGELVAVERLKAKSAVTTLQFNLTQALGSVYTIPVGTRVNAGELDFATTENLDISAGQTSGTVTAECTTSGVVGNKLLPGQIKTMVNPMAYVASVSNTTETSGGADKEDDESLVNRIRLAPASFSTAGPKDAYVYWALAANQSIIDVGVSSPSPGVVDVRPLMQGGIIPAQEVLDQVDAILSDDSVRPLTDLVNVTAPTAENYSVNFNYWVSNDDASRLTYIQAQVSQAAIDYISWQKAKIGRDINPDELLKRVKDAGAKRVTITSPTFTVLDATKVAQDINLSVNYQGLEDG